MKKIFLSALLLLSISMYKAEAQVSVNINIGSQPLWGPAGYDYVNYYYLPDLDMYYDVPRGMFVYFNSGRWVFAASLPARYRNYNLYNCYKVVINDRDPWLRESYYRGHYHSFRGYHQDDWRDSHDERYWRERQKHEGGYDNGWGNGGRNNGRGNGWGHYKHGDNDDHGHGHRHGRDD